MAEKPRTLRRTSEMRPSSVAVNPGVLPDIISPNERATLTRRKKLQTFFIMTAICMAAFLAALDMTIITAALPTIAMDIKASDSGFAWIGATYLIGNAASTPLWGKISDIFGRKPILIISNVVFMIGSLISALAVSLNMLIVGRTVQGIGSEGLLVLANIVVIDIFSQRDRGLYLGLVGLTYAFASVICPVVGGLFAEDLSWRWCFWSTCISCHNMAKRLLTAPKVNLPCDGLSLILIFFFLKVHNPRTPMLEGLKATDWLGALTVAGSTVMFSLGLEFGGVTYPWSSATVSCLISHGISTFLIFLLFQWKIAKHPIMPLRLFNDRSDAAIFIVVIAQGMAFISTA